MEGILRRMALMAAIVAIMAAFTAAKSVENELGWGSTLAAAAAGCRGTVGECLAGGEEFDLGSEPSRRILGSTGYISYAVLQRDSVPCSVRGASYYNCRAGAQANPYTRGCSAITQCRS